MLGFWILLFALVIFDGWGRSSTFLFILLPNKACPRCLPLCLSTCLSLYLPVCPSIFSSIYLCHDWLWLTDFLTVWPTDLQAGSKNKNFGIFSTCTVILLLFDLKPMYVKFLRKISKFFWTNFNLKSEIKNYIDEKWSVLHRELCPPQIGFNNMK